jgi:hypothetical protein
MHVQNSLSVRAPANGTQRAKLCETAPTKTKTEMRKQCSTAMTWYTERSNLVVDSRNARRYALAFPVLFKWKEPDGAECQAGGFTRDVSTTGTYITCGVQAPSISTVIAVEVLLPSLDTGLARLALKVDARVVRTGEPEEQRGFAVMTNFSTYDRIDG